MVQKYQNEIAPTFYYGISTRTNEKDLKILDLQALTLGRVKKMTLYFVLSHLLASWWYSHGALGLGSDCQGAAVFLSPTICTLPTLAGDKATNLIVLLSCN